MTTNETVSDSIDADDQPVARAFDVDGELAAELYSLEFALECEEMSRISIEYTAQAPDVFA